MTLLDQFIHLVVLIAGKTSFEDLRTIGSTVFGSFQEVCCVLGLLKSTTEWEKVFKEAISSLSGSKSRSFFVMLLIFCEIPNPTKHLMKHVQELSEDLSYGYPTLTAQQLQTVALTHIGTLLKSHGRTLQHYSLPVPTSQKNWDVEVCQQGNDPAIPQILGEETDFDRTVLKSFVERCKAGSDDPRGLRPSQMTFFNSYMRKLSENRQTLIFFDARCGTGKTYVLNAFLAEVRTSDESAITRAIAVASSRTAAIALSGGRTFHSRFRAPLKIEEFSSLDISVQTSLAALIRVCLLIVWDEAPMAHRFLLEALDRSLRDIMESDLPFGGKNVLLAGDFRFVIFSSTKRFTIKGTLFFSFRQILPVTKNATRAQIVESCLKSSQLWKYFVRMSLTENIRLSFAHNLSQAELYDSWLLKVGNGKAPDDRFVELPLEKVAIISQSSRRVTLCDAIHWTFGELFHVCAFLRSTFMFSIP